ncbi:site-specific integrase [Streptomyces decoyicus]|uniref:site-specific integrase n=1 Tax=Streptomyces decoyicus TaxID=249567 RepID=UPI002E16DF89|nr:tyrosine-type recombinase/integrase [Streptomyces decoyicus]
MPTSRRGGGVTKRCECRGPTGQLLGSSCPQLAKKNHGALLVRQELPLDGDGKRRPFRRTGYGKLTDAQKDLDRIRAILDLAGEDEDAQMRVGDFLQGLMTSRAPIPETAEVSRRLGVGVPLDGRMTVEQWLEVWMASKKTRATTNRSYRSHIKAHLIPRIGHLRLDRLSVGHLGEMFDAIADESEVIAAENAARHEQIARCRWSKPGRPPAAARGKLAEERARLAEMKPFRKTNGAATRQSIRRTLRTALNAAIARQLITFNAAAHVELETARRPKGLLWTAPRVAEWRRTGQKPSPVMVWTPVQLGAFLDAAEEDRLYAFFHLIAHHGLRRGEGVGQSWSDVHFQAKEIRVAKEIVTDGWTPIETDPKTDESASTVRIDSGTVAVLQAHHLRQMAERDARLKADLPWTDTGKVFTKEDGTWLHPETVSDAFRRIVAAADLPPINLRDLRHGAAALVKEGGGDLHDAKVKLRHSTIVLTSNTYMELFEEAEQELTERAAAVVPRARRAAAPAEPPAAR